jgi:KDO2-lipid IV(A) lauroyltransferase
MSQSKKVIALINPLYWPAWVMLGLLWLVTRLPFRWQIQFGAALGHLFYYFPSKLKHITTINIALCFPNLSTQEQKQLVRKNFNSMGIGIIEAAMAWWLPNNKLTSRYTLHGFEYAEQAFAKGKGIILVGPHFTCLEMIGRLLGMKYAFAVMYRPHKKPFIAFVHEKFRQRHYVNYIASNRIRGLLQALTENKAIWYAYDIDAGEKKGVFAPFFGIPTASLTTVSRLVELSGATVIPISFHRTQDLNYEVNLLPPLNNFPTIDPVADATRLNSLLEQAIRNQPEQYVWQYKRFKTRPAGEKRIY